MKRSAAPQDGQHPDYIRLLETLNIFALRANYMAQFRDYLESEGIDTGTIELPLFIRSNTDFLNKGLVIPRLETGQTFAGQETVLLRYEEKVRPVSVTMAATVQQIASREGGVSETGATSGSSQQIPSESLDLVDWNKAYLDLLEYKEAKGLSNLLVRPRLLRPILEAGKETYLLEADQSVVKPKDHGDHLRLQEAVANILRRYADALYRSRQSHWESNNLTYRKLEEHDPNLRFNIGEKSDAGQYIIRVSQGSLDLAREIEQLVAEIQRPAQGRPGTFAASPLRPAPLPAATDRNRTCNFIPTPLGGKRAPVRRGFAGLLCQRTGFPASRRRAVPASEPDSWQRRGLLRKQWLLPRFHTLDQVQ